MKKLWIGLLLVIFLAGCGNGKSDTVKIGYFPNLTHVATIIGLEKGYFQDELGKDTKIETKTVSNGGLFMEAMTQQKPLILEQLGPDLRLISM